MSLIVIGRVAPGGSREAAAGTAGRPARPFVLGPCRCHGCGTLVVLVKGLGWEWRSLPAESRRADGISTYRHRCTVLSLSEKECE